MDGGLHGTRGSRRVESPQAYASNCVLRLSATAGTGTCVQYFIAIVSDYKVPHLERLGSRRVFEFSHPPTVILGHVR